MPLTLRWIGESEYDRLAAVRHQCYGAGPSTLDRFRKTIELDTRGKPGDYLIAERDGIDVGTTTSFALRLWIRGGCVPCQGVAYVGTVKTHRRGGKNAERGIASQIMAESIKKARERGDVVSALMPFRASFYSHFGYGLAERRTDWTLPLSVLPTGDFDGFHFVTPADHAAIVALRQRECEQGQCNIERSIEGWKTYRNLTMPRYDGLEAVDRPNPTGPALGWIFFIETKEDDKTHLRVLDQSWDSPDALKRQLHFLASLKDQYSVAHLTLPGDLQLNRLLKEDQLAHRSVEHACANATLLTRMQIRILDHKRLLEAMKLPAGTNGKLTLAIHECESNVSKFRIEITDGRIAVSPAGESPDLECSDVTWASLVSADISASDALKLNLIKAASSPALRLLNTFSEGPAPFCQEYF
ncbi:MAG TPA: GNAT family N-acetyltransferase [Tepidisphaeraceae bacterium]|nr:GNAT family N-acetyltransferase [Tepidisphaeraceae bacterium]